jgi:hypothetical protein
VRSGHKIERYDDGQVDHPVIILMMANLIRQVNPHVRGSDVIETKLGFCSTKFFRKRVEKD